MIRWGAVVAVPCLLFGHVAKAQTNAAFDTALQTCLSSELAVEARLQRFEEGGWILLQDSRGSRELIALHRFFFMQLVQLQDSWDGSNDDLRTSFNDMVSRPDVTFKMQADAYGGTFSAQAAMANAPQLFLSLQHPDVNGHVMIHAQDLSAGETVFTCDFLLANMPATDDLRAMIPAEAANVSVTTDVPHPGSTQLSWASKAPEDASATIEVRSLPLSGVPHYDDFLKFLQIETRLDGVLSTSVDPVVLR